MPEQEQRKSLADITLSLVISLATSRTVLRPWTDDDFDQYAALCGDPEVMKYIGDGRPKTEAEAVQSFRRLVTGWHERGYGLLAVERIDTGQVAGFSGLGEPDFLPDILPAVEIGWRLNRDSWGLGIGTEAASAVLDWAFGPLGLDRVVAVIRVENVRSQRVASKLGMQRERRTILPCHGVWADVYELHRDQWPAGPALTK